MRRRLSAIGTIAGVLVAMSVLGGSARAQDDRSVIMAAHPIVGAWFVDPVANDPGNTPNMTVINADGTVRDETTDGSGIGAWTPTGWRSANLIIVYAQVDESSGFIGSTTVRSSVVAAEDGLTFDGTYTISFPFHRFDVPAGSQLGPAVVTGERILVEPMGLPAGPWPPQQGGAGAGGVTVATATGRPGTFLVGPDGMTLYTFAVDTTPGVSACVEGCADVWPPFIVAEGAELVPGRGVSGDLEVIQRADGTSQVAHDGRPLYRYAGDSAPGDTTGHGIGDVWFVALADG